MIEPIHRWRLDKDCVDSVGGLATTNNGGVTFDPVNGASFNGVNQWLSFEKNLPQIFSMSIWISVPSTYTDNRSPFAFSTAGASKATGFQYYNKTTYGYVNDNTINSVGDFSDINYPSGVPVLCTLTYDGSTLSLYRGKNLIVSKNIPSITSSTITGAIGRFGAYAGIYFKGNLLDARIYNVALTQADVTALNSVGPNGGGGSTPNQRPQAIGGF